MEKEIMDSKGKVLAIIGGGSFFTPSFIGTMCRRPEVWDNAEVRLYDMDRERVRLVIAFCEKFTQVKKVRMTFRDEPDLDRALAGADFVITTFRIGGVRSLMKDETIPLRFGYFGDETAGPGGLFMAIRTVPVVLDVARRMQRLCPEAWLLNYANPTNYISDALHRSGFTRSVGLCDGYTCAPRGFAFTLDIPKYLVNTRHAGLNHCGWVYKAETDGRDLMAELRALPQEIAERNLTTKHSESAQEILRFLEIFRMMGLFPALADHQMPYFFHDECLADEQCGNRAHKTVEERSQGNWDRLKAVLKNFNEAAADDVAKAHQGAHADLAIGVASALATDSGEEFPVNLPHGNAMAGFPPETVLEVYSRVTRHGFAPVNDIPDFPKAVVAQQLHLAMVQQILVQGILEKDRRLLMQAFSIHPFTKSYAKARACFETMWNEEKAFLGDYWRGVQ